MFSPIKRVNFHVENARVGRMTDYDKLTLGNLDGRDHLASRCLVQRRPGILRDHLDIFINPEERSEAKPVSAADEAQREVNKNLFRSVNELELSVRAANCLKNANIKTIADLVQKTEGEMLRTKNFGKKSLNEIKEILTEMGLGLGVKVDALPSGDQRQSEERVTKQEGTRASQKKGQTARTTDQTSMGAVPKSRDLAART